MSSRRNAVPAACRWPRVGASATAADYLARVPPIPPPRTDGFTRTTAVPLYWAAYGREGTPQLLCCTEGPARTMTTCCRRCSIGA